MARFEAASRGDLIAMLVKQKSMSHRYQRKLTDVVAAYKDAAASSNKMQTALEKQQDEALRRTRESNEAHKKDLAAKDKLATAIKRRTESLQAELQAVQVLYTDTLQGQRSPRRCLAAVV